MMYWGDHMSTGGWIFSILATLIEPDRVGRGL